MRTADLRTTWLGASAWAGSLVGLVMSGWGVAVVAALAALAGVVLRRNRLVLACLVTMGALAITAFVRSEATLRNPVTAWARQRPVVEAVLTVRSDPVTRQGRFGSFVVLDARLVSMVVRGRSVRSPVPVLVIGSQSWSGVPLGSRVRGTARLAPADRDGQAAVLSAVGPPVQLRAPPRAFALADGVRAAIRRAAAGGPDQASALVPALVTGEDQNLSPALVADFRAAGLTHLTAVSGTNLTLVLASLMLVAGWCRVRGRAHLGVGLAGIAGFVLLARPEPSVLRAAAMGTVALVALGSTGGSGRGARALGVAVVGLLVFDPRLAVSPGFALSALATAGILFAAPAMVSALGTWLPRPVAEAVAVPLAAQLSATPLVAALSGQVSLVAVLANVVVAPAVAPATVLGLAGGLIGLAVPVAGWLVSRPAVWSAQLIVVVAERAAALPGAALEWPVTALGLGALVVVATVAAGAAPRALRSRGWALGGSLVLLGVVFVGLPSPGWPPSGWLLVMCDVGQGDALVLNTGPQQAVVIDTGPDPRLVDRCLDRLDVRRLPALVITHFDADHVGGLPGLLGGRSVAEVQVSALRQPPYGAAQVDREAAGAGVPVRVAAYGETARVGPVSWQVVGPQRILSDSSNDASVVLLVQSRGLRLLLAGDAEAPAQQLLEGEGLGSVDVLKAPHHGSANQDFAFLRSLRPRVALVSVGAGNPYGHPRAATMTTLARTGAVVRRTDRDGDVAVVPENGRLEVVSR